MTVPSLTLLSDNDPHSLRRRARSLATEDVVSRSYADPFAVVASWTREVGVDIVRPVDDDRFSLDDPDFRALIMSPEDCSARGSRSTVSAWDIWSSKEAAAKASGDPLGYVPAQHFSPCLWPEGRLGPWRALRIAGLPDELTGWVVFLDEVAGTSSAMAALRAIPKPHDRDDV